MKWLDRDKQKTRISEWLATDSAPFLLTVMDSQEFEDITSWLGSLHNISTTISYFNTDSEVTRFGLLEEIVHELGKDKFPKFTAFQESISNTEIKLTINQTIGSQIESKSSINFEENTQTININSPDPEALKRYFFDSKINDFFYHFLQDLGNIADAKEILIVCRFRGKGFDNLDEKFKYWFQDQFIRKIKLHKIKALILCEQNASELVNTFDYQFQYCFKELELTEILPISKQYLNDEGGLFCKGIVNNEDKIAYNLFKFKLQKNILA